MSCSCGKAQPFEVIVNDERKIIYGLDVIVFQVTILTLLSEKDIKEKLWEYTLQYNRIPESKKFQYEVALYDAYLDMEHLFEKYK